MFMLRLKYLPPPPWIRFYYFAMTILNISYNGVSTKIIFPFEPSNKEWTSIIIYKNSWLSRQRQWLKIICYIFLFLEIKCIAYYNSKFETLIWPITDTECQIWAKLAKLSFLTVHIFSFKTFRKKTATFHYT